MSYPFCPVLNPDCCPDLAHTRLVHPAHMQHGVMALQFAPVCQNRATSRPDKPELAQIWAALHFYFSGLDPASSGLFGSLLADTWDQVCSDLANRSEWPGCHHSPRCVGRINASYTILIKPPQPAVKNSYKQHFNVSSVSDSREHWGEAASRGIPPKLLNVSPWNVGPTLIQKKTSADFSDAVIFHVQPTKDQS